MPKTEQQVVIQAPIAHVYDVIVDYESYPEFLPDMKRVEVRERHDGVAVVSFELEIIMRIGYTLRLVEDRPSAVTWTLESAKMMSRNNGGWTLEPVDDAHTRVTYGLDIELKGLIPKSVSERLLGKTLPETLQLFKTRAEAKS